MRLTHFLCVVIFYPIISFCQIPNSGFEDWVTDPDSNSNPVGWQTTNSYPIVNVEPVTPGCSGNFALKVKTVNIGLTIPGAAILETAYNFTQRPTKFTACVKSNIVAGDIPLIMIALFKGDSSVAAIDSCTFKIDTTINQFTHMEFPIAYLNNLLPDSLIVIVLSGFLNGHVGTELIIDDIAFSFEGSTDMIEHKNMKTNFTLNQNYPNPFNPVTTISYSIASSAIVELKVYDVLGNEITSLVNGEQPAGTYKVNFDTQGLSSGMYFYTLQSDGFIETRKMILIK